MPTPTSFAHDDSNRRTWKSILKETDHGHRKLYCSDLFSEDRLNMNRCMEPHIYCKYRCNGEISNIENVLNFNCWFDCVKGAAAEPVKSPIQKAIPVNYLQYFPKVNDKCDYKPSGKSTYYSATVKELTKKGNAQFAQIDYVVENGEKRSIFVQYPTSSLLECGKGLTVRTDCK